MSIQRIYTHGHAVQLERVGAPRAVDKKSIKDRVFRPLIPADLLELGGRGRVACVRIGWAARFVVFDAGSENKPKSGSFWCHFAIPAPIVLAAGRRTQATRVQVNYESTNPAQLDIARLHIWDGNRRIFADDAFVAPRGGSNGGIPGQTTNPNNLPQDNPLRLYGRALVRRDVFFGIGVSLMITARRSRDTFLEIRSVGMEFDVPETVPAGATKTGRPVITSTARKPRVSKSAATRKGYK